MMTDEPELKFYRIIGPDGLAQFRAVSVSALPPRWDRSGPRPVRVPRLPEAFEDWDESTGQFVLNKAARADSEAGQDHIARAHAMKAVEALLLLAGVEIDGMIAAEARALGMDQLQLAGQIADKVRADIDAEVARRVAKVPAS